MRPLLTIQPEEHDDAKPEKKVHKPATDNLITLFLYCHGEPEVLAQRIAARKGHFMGPKMLESQLAALQDPRKEPGVAWVNIDASKEKVAEDAERNTRELFHQLDAENK